LDYRWNKTLDASSKRIRGLSVKPITSAGKSKGAIMSDMSKFVAALVGLLFMAFVVSWQVFLFVLKRDPAGVNTEGGIPHLWLALGAGIIACIAGSLMFRFHGRHEKTKWFKVELTPTGPLLATLGGNQLINSPAPVLFDAEHWALANPWLSEGQADDRMPIAGSVAHSGQTPSGQRTFARRTHQLMFKRWSQARHD
jgi:hypothetical protein